MKIQLDTALKIIRIEETVNLGELIDLLESMLPNGTWKEFKIETQNIINWKDPFVIPYKPQPIPIPVQPYPSIPYPNTPYPTPMPWWELPYTICSSDRKLVNGTFNIDVTM